MATATMTLNLADIREVEAVIHAARLVLLSGASEREIARLQTALFLLDNRESDDPRLRELADGLFADLQGGR